MKVIAALMAALLCSMPNFVEANTTLDDCLLSSLKGVSSDVAARMVRQACENKVKAGMQQALVAKYGESVDDELEFTGIGYKDGGVVLLMRNESSKTALMVNVKVSRVEANGKCGVYADAAYVYRTKLKPGGRAELWAPVLKLVDEKHGICAHGVAVRSRAASWTDIDFGIARPMPSHELDQVNQELRTSYGTVHPAPVAAPPAAGSGMYESLIVRPPAPTR